MKKFTTQFVCQECGYESSQWLGKCPECGNWNTLKEFKIKKQEPRSKDTRQVALNPKKLQEITSTEKTRIKTGFSEMDNVLGGGVVKGSVILLAGDPGIGKSTLLLQLALQIAGSRFAVHSSQKKNDERTNELTNIKVLYISGEESVDQVKMRAMRLVGDVANENMYLISLTTSDDIPQLIEDIKPKLVIVDSIQTMESENVGGLSGSVGQIRYATSLLVKTAKTANIPIILVGHVTKEGMVAGPMMLAHMVDCVLFLEGEKFTSTRILRSLKNRFGPVDEVGIFTMEGSGMKEVTHPEQIFLSSKNQSTPGSVLVVIMEGTRPFLIEIQALVVYSKLPMPRRVAAGIDSRRLELLLAVLQKHCRLPLETMDVFVNIAGGIKVVDPAADIGICLAVYSSLKNKILTSMVGIAEVGLLGELRMVSSVEKRIKEAQKLGFSNIITAKTHNSLSNTIKALDTV